MDRVHNSIDRSGYRVHGLGPYRFGMDLIWADGFGSYGGNWIGHEDGDGLNGVKAWWHCSSSEVIGGGWGERGDDGIGSGGLIEVGPAARRWLDKGRA
jgi:hypothetical protein